MQDNLRRIRGAGFACATLLVVGAPRLGGAQEPPKVEAPKVEAPKVEPPKVEAPAEPPASEPQVEQAPIPREALPKELVGDVAPSAVQPRDLSTITVRELSDQMVYSASNHAELATQAPAWVISITGEELFLRGYRELSDLLDDLPGMDVIRPRGDTYFKTYWRGYRNEIGSPFLLMVDGIIFNHLWLNHTEIMAAIPMSNIDRVEVVYGPASSVYGPNAAMGVINVFTRRRREINGFDVKARFRLHSPQHTLPETDDITKIADLSVFYQSDLFRLSVTGRFDFGVLDRSIGENFEWTKNRYYSDRTLWGGFVDFPDLAGEFKSPSQKQALDARVFVGDTEIAATHYRMENGNGLSYPADRLQTRPPFTFLEQSFHLKHEAALARDVASSSLIRYRRSNVDSPSTYLGRSEQGVEFQYWQSTNFAFIASQELQVITGRDLFVDGDRMQIQFGAKYEHRDLEKGYVISGAGVFWDPAVPFEGVDGGPSYRFPEPNAPAEHLENRSELDLVGAHAQLKYTFLEHHNVNFGLRVDYNSILDSVEPTFRAGYQGRFFEDFYVKALYGQAVQEPTWRELFGAWNGTGANPGLRSERSQTGELIGTYLTKLFSVQANVWIVDYLDAILLTSGTGQNIGRRITIGADLSGTLLVPIPGIKRLEIRAFYSPYIYARQTPAGGSATDPLVPIGDLAAHKVSVAATFELDRYFAASAVGRCYSERAPVSTNPLEPVPAYCTIDGQAMFRDFLAEGLSLALRVENLLDTTYFHPGIVTADSGATPGSSDSGVWVGSQGFYNSYLPQPGRAFSLQVGLDL